MLRQRKIRCCRAAGKPAIRGECSKDQRSNSQTADLPTFGWICAIDLRDCSAIDVESGKPTCWLDAVTRIDAILVAGREITGLSDAARHEARQQWVAPMVNDLRDWMLAERAWMSNHNPVAKTINYMLEGTGRWEAFAAILDHGRLCLTIMSPNARSEGSHRVAACLPAEADLPLTVALQNRISA